MMVRCLLGGQNVTVDMCCTVQYSVQIGFTCLACWTAVHVLVPSLPLSLSLFLSLYLSLSLCLSVSLSLSISLSLSLSPLI